MYFDRYIDSYNIYIISIGGASGMKTTSPSCFFSSLIRHANLDVFNFSSSQFSVSPTVSVSEHGSSR